MARSTEPGPVKLRLEPSRGFLRPSDGQDPEAIPFSLRPAQAGRDGSGPSLDSGLVFFSRSSGGTWIPPRGAVLGPHAGDLREDGLRCKVGQPGGRGSPCALGATGHSARHSLGDRNPWSHSWELGSWRGGLQCRLPCTEHAACAWPRGGGSSPL